MGTHDSTIVLRLPAELKQDLQDEAADLDLSISELIRLKLATASSSQPKERVVRIGERTFRLEDILRPDILSYDYVASERLADSSLFVWEPEAHDSHDQPGMGSIPFSTVIQDIIRQARIVIERLKGDRITSDHLLFGLLVQMEGNGIGMLRNLGIDCEKMAKHIEEEWKKSGRVFTLGNVPLSREATKMIKLMELETGLCKQKVSGSEHLLLAMLRDSTNFHAGKRLAKENLSYEGMRELLLGGMERYRRGN